MEENTTNQKAKKRNKKPQKKLPWIIEILFVQLGLPEKLLINYLSFEKKARNHIDENLEKYKIIILIGLAFIYINPIIESYRRKNICIDISYDKLKEEGRSKQAKALATNYCYGGSSIIFKV